MHEGFNLAGFSAGLLVGMVITTIILFINWRKGKKERRYDERYVRVREQAGRLAWSVTVLAIVVACAVLYIFEGKGLAFYLLIVLYVISMMFYLIAVAIADKKN